MHEFVNDVAVFIDDADVKILRVLARDKVAILSIMKIFENPERAGKFLVLIRNRPAAIYLVAKIAERISRYLSKQDAGKCFDLFLNSILMLKDVHDRTIRQKVFLLLKESMDRRIREEKFEELAKLLSKFYDLGFKSYLDNLLFSVSLLAEKGEYQKAVNILNLINLDTANQLKSHILIEWARSIVQYDPEKALENLREALEIDEANEDAILTLANVYGSMKEYEKAVKIYEIVSSREALYKTAEILKAWSKELDSKDALEKLKEAYKIAIEIDEGLAEEIFNSIKEVLEKEFKEEKEGNEGDRFEANKEIENDNTEIIVETENEKEER